MSAASGPPTTATSVATTMVESDRFGSLAVPTDSLIEFAAGIPGFPELKAAVLLEVDEDGLFWWLQSASDPALAFLLVRPGPFFPDYAPDAVVETMTNAEIEVLCIVTVDRNRSEMTANLMAPIVFDVATRQARQVTLDDDDLPLRAPLGR